MEYEEMRQMVNTHVCTQCEAALSLIWDMFDDCYKLVCGYDPKHQGYKLIPTAGQALARGEMDKHLGKGAQKDLEKMAAEGAPAISRLQHRDIASGELIPIKEMVALVEWGQKLGLNPYLGHVCLYFGKPYVTIDGYYYLLNRYHPALKIGTRPLTMEERLVGHILDEDMAYLAEAWEKGEKLPTTGLGIVTKEEIEGKSEKRDNQWRAPVAHGHPQRMAEKRAEWQLLRKLIPLEESD